MTALPGRLSSCIGCKPTKAQRQPSLNFAQRLNITIILLFNMNFYIKAYTHTHTHVHTKRMSDEKGIQLLSSRMKRSWQNAACTSERSFSTDSAWSSWLSPESMPPEFPVSSRLFKFLLAASPSDTAPWLSRLNTGLELKIWCGFQAYMLKERVVTAATAIRTDFVSKKHSEKTPCF